jgi:signal transduction histidine kinase
MTRLVDDLLDVSRLRAGRLKILLAPADIVAICQSVVDSWSAIATRHTIVLQTDRTEITAIVDGDRIHQVLDNLVSNAVKYADEGRITVSIAMGSLPGHAEAVSIQVIDEGPGIHAADRDAVFTPFYRTRVASQSAVPGLGLGLYISSEIVHEHDGAMTITETASGGSCFAISLPLHIDTADH